MQSFYCNAWRANFINALPTQNQPYGTTIRAFLQRFLQNTGGEQILLHQGPHTNNNVYLVAGDFWMNIYADSLNVGADLLSGTGLSRYVSIRKIVSKAEENLNADFDFVIVDLPPSFGALVRAAFYASDYYIVPCTSDNFCIYCVGLIGRMVPSFIDEWQIGLTRFKASNPQFPEFDNLGSPVFAGWIFNGFDTARERRTQAEIAAGVLKEKIMIRADETMHDRLQKAVEDDLVAALRSGIKSFGPVANNMPAGFRIGDIEDANVLIQNSLWLSVPLGQLTEHQQVVSLYDRRKWAPNQEEQILLLRSKFIDAAERVIAICV
jgi:cellulose biosynthesis protein BcsQ